MIVSSKSAIEALYEAASQVVPLIRLPPPAGRLKTYTDTPDADAQYLHEYVVSVNCTYTADAVDGSGGESNSAAEALVNAALYDNLNREHQAAEW